MHKESFYDSFTPLFPQLSELSAHLLLGRLSLFRALRKARLLAQLNFLF